MSNCPKCEKSVTQLSFVSAPIKSGTFEVNGIVITCPHCNVILGAGVDPQTFVDTVASAVVDRLRK